MNKYITVDPRPSRDAGHTWWVPEQAPAVIKVLEFQNPKYEFVQFVTSPGNGGYPSYALMRRKNE